MSQQPPKQIQLIKSLKNCISQTTNLYKCCQIVPKTLQSPKDVIDYANNLLKILKYISTYIQQNMIINTNYNKLKQEKQENQQKMAKIQRQNIDVKCQLDIMKNKFKEIQEKFRKISEDKVRQKRYSLDFQNKLDKIKQDSEQGIRKIIETTKSTEMKVYQRNNSLPSIHNYANREKIGLLLLMGPPVHKPPKNKSIFNK